MTKENTLPMMQDPTAIRAKTYVERVTEPEDPSPSLWASANLASSLSFEEARTGAGGSKSEHKVKKMQT